MQGHSLGALGAEQGDRKGTLFTSGGGGAGVGVRAYNRGVDEGAAISRPAR